MDKAILIYTPKWADIDLGSYHPLKMARLERTHDLMKACGLLERAGVGVREPVEANEEALRLVHRSEYIRVAKFLSDGGSVASPWKYGLGTADNPIVQGMYEIAALAVGGTVLAAQLIIEGGTGAAFNIGGGFHHAHAAAASGFCLFNDVAIAIHHILRTSEGDARVAYIDVDAHHGDGVEQAFFQTDRVLTISVHESGRYLFPGSGFADEIGKGAGAGYAVNLPLAPFTDDETYIWAFHEIVPPLVEAFQPDVLVTQLGADTHYRDPLTHLCLTTSGYLAVVRQMKRLSQGRWLATGGGGYDTEVVPRCWTLAFAEMAEVNLAQPIPKSVASDYPTTQGQLRDHDGPHLSEERLETARAFAEESVAAVRRHVFPRHGL